MAELDLAAIVLSAGQSQRMGQPKALLNWQGRSFLRCVIDLALGAKLRPIVVIEGAQPLSEHLVGLPVECVAHPGWQDGPFSSLQVGIHALVTTGLPLAGAVVFTVDRPRVSPLTVAELGAHARHSPTCIWQPSFHGQRAHPLYLPMDVFATIIAALPTCSLREILRSPSWTPRRATFVSEDPGVIENLDSPAALIEAGLDIGEWDP